MPALIIRHNQPVANQRRAGPITNRRIGRTPLINRAEVEAAAREERRFSAVIDRLVTDWAVARDLARIGNPK